MEKLSADLNSFEDSLILHGDPVYPHEPHVLQSTRAALLEVTDSSFQEAFLGARKLAFDVQFLETRQALSNLNCRKDQALMLAMYVALSRWLDTVETECCVLYNSAQISENTTGRSGWLGSLVIDVKNMILSRTLSRSFNTADYFVDNMASTSTTITRRFTLNEGNETHSASTAKVVVDILCSWMHIIQPEDRWKLWMLDIVVQTFGPGALALHATWKLFGAATKYSITKKTTAAINRADLSKFQEALQTLPLANAQSEDAQIVDSLLDYSSCIWPEFQLTLSTHLGVGEKSLITSTAESICKRRLCLLIDFVKRSLETLKDKELGMDFNDPDEICPFRECINERIKMRSQGGPYSQNIINTNRGLFSAIIWRTVTMFTPFADTEDPVYDNFNQWHQRAEEVIHFEGESYIGGQFSKAKNLLQKCWHAVETLDWEEFSQTYPSFMDMFNYLYPSSKDPLLPGLGPTGAMNLATDMALGGICAMPTHAEMSQCIFICNGYTAKAIQYLNARSASAPRESQDSISHTLSTIQVSLQETFNANDEEIMGTIDVPFVEHCLNTFERNREHRKRPL